MSPVRAKGCLPDVLDGWCAKGGNRAVAAQRGCAATRRLVWARAHPKQRRTAAPQCEGHGGGQGGLERSAAKPRRLPGSGPRLAGQPRGECLGGEWRWGKERQRHDHRHPAGPQGRHAGPRASASPRGVSTPRPRRAARPVPAAPRSTPRVGPLLRRRPGERRQAARGLPQSQTAWAAVAQAASPRYRCPWAIGTVVPERLQKWPAPGSLEGVRIRGRRNPEALSGVGGTECWDRKRWNKGDFRQSVAHSHCNPWYKTPVEG